MDRETALQNYREAVSRKIAAFRSHMGDSVLEHAEDWEAVVEKAMKLLGEQMEKQGIHVKVSDISDAMNLPRPGVTRTVKEMEEKGYLQKIASPDDGRVTYISITEDGRELSRKYNESYFNELSPYLDEISEEEADNMIQTIEKFYQIMCERRKEYDKRQS